MERNEILRKAVHMCAPLFATAYLVPDDLGAVSRDTIAIVLWIAFGLFEIYRIKTKMPIAGLREYEYSRPSASFWMCTAFLPMILFFPWTHTLPLLLGFAFVDPLIGILRKSGSKLYPAVPSISYMMIVLPFFAFAFGITFDTILISVAVTVSAIIAESFRNSIVDDDFLMLFVPLAVLWLFTLLQT